MYPSIPQWIHHPSIYLEDIGSFDFKYVLVKPLAFFRVVQEGRLQHTMVTHAFCLDWNDPNRPLKTSMRALWRLIDSRTIDLSGRRDLGRGWPVETEFRIITLHGVRRWDSATRQTRTSSVVRQSRGRPNDGCAKTSSFFWCLLLKGSGSRCH